MKRHEFSQKFSYAAPAEGLAGMLSLSGIRSHYSSVRNSDGIITNTVAHHRSVLRFEPAVWEQAHPPPDELRQRCMLLEIYHMDFYVTCLFKDAVIVSTESGEGLYVGIPNDVETLLRTLKVDKAKLVVEPAFQRTLMVLSQDHIRIYEHMRARDGFKIGADKHVFSDYRIISPLRVRLIEDIWLHVPASPEEKCYLDYPPDDDLKPGTLERSSDL